MKKLSLIFLLLLTLGVSTAWSKTLIISEQGAVVTINTSDKEIYLLPLGEIVSIRVSHYHPDNTEREDYYLEITTTALVQSGESEQVAVNEKIRIEKLTFDEARKASVALGSYLGDFSEGRMN